MHNTAKSFDDILPPETVTAENPHIPTASIKWDIHERHNNGAAEANCFTKIGKKFFVIVPNYLSWKLNKTA